LGGTRFFGGVIGGMLKQSEGSKVVIASDLVGSVVHIQLINSGGHPPA
jgi:hypothetical protein